MRIPCPCTQDCPSRTITCKSTCSKHKLYLCFRDVEYARRVERARAEEYIIDRNNKYTKKALRDCKQATHNKKPYHRYL